VHANRTSHIEATGSRHREVEHDNIGRERTSRFDRGLTVADAANDIDVERFVVRD
jgi:hypothetical protein